MKQLIKKLPLVGPLAAAIKQKLFAPRPFSDSTTYWKERYNGDNSGGGSHGHLAAFKADVLNRFVQKNSIQTIIEHGCGDGHQLSLAFYPNYLGLDISPTVIALCQQKFSDDKTKRFIETKDYVGQTAECVLSLDVIFHLIEDNVFDTYMKQLFDSATHYIAIYSSNTNEQKQAIAPHVKHRKFSDWIEKNARSWKLIEHIPNNYPFSRYGSQGSFAEFFFYKSLSEN